MAEAPHWVRDLASGDLPVQFDAAGGSRADWLQALGAGTVQIECEDGSTPTLTVGLGAVVPGPFRQCLAMTSSAVRFGRGPLPSHVVGTAATQVAHAHGGTTATDSGYHMVCLSATALPAAGVSMHATDAGGAALALVAGFTSPLPARSLVITRSNVGPASVDYLATWTLADGTTATETISCGKNGTSESTIAGVLTSVTTTVDPVSSSAFATGTGFSIGGPFVLAGAALSFVAVREAIVSSHAASGTIFPTTAPSGLGAYTINAIMSSHSHAIASATPVIAVALT